MSDSALFKDDQGSTCPSPWEVAGLPAPPYARKDILLPRQWFRAVRKARGLTQRAVIQGVAAYVPEAPLTLSHLAHLEGGRLSLLSVQVDQMEGLRRILDVPVSVWHRVFSEDRGSTSSPTRPTAS